MLEQLKNSACFTQIWSNESKTQEVWPVGKRLTMTLTCQLTLNLVMLEVQLCSWMKFQSFAQRTIIILNGHSMDQLWVWNSLLTSTITKSLWKTMNLLIIWSMCMTLKENQNLTNTGATKMLLNLQWFFQRLDYCFYINTTGIDMRQCILERKFSSSLKTLKISSLQSKFQTIIPKRLFKFNI